MGIEKRDIIILGGGIAGLTLAKYLAEERIDFVLIEKNNKFFKKACGEGITTKLAGYDFFDLYESKKGVERITDDIIISTKYGKINMNTPNIISNKMEVEEELANQAKRKGARIIMGAKVDQIKKYNNNLLILPQNISSKIIVGADGVNSMVRKYMGIERPDCGIGASGIRKAETSDKCYIEFKKDVAPRGYSWFFPKKEVWNIGVGTANPNYFKECFSKFKNRFPEIKKWKVDLVPVSMPLKSYSKNTILIGDSAAQVVAVFGDGILPSMICAKIAADELTKIAKNDFKSLNLSTYEKAWQDKLYKTFKEGYIAFNLLSKVYFSDYFLHVTLKLLCRMSLKAYKN